MGATIGTAALMLLAPLAFGGKLDGSADGGESVGRALATGDFDGDGYADLAISATGQSAAGIDYAGVVHIVYGGPASLSDLGNQVWHQGSPGLHGGVELEDENFGAALAAGDFDADGADDLAIGVPQASDGDLEEAGAVYVLLGVLGEGLSAADHRVWSQDTPGIHEKSESFDWFGGKLATGDFDGDGFADLVITATNDDTLGGGQPVHVIYGSVVGLSAEGNQLFDDGLFFGDSLAAGDFDGDARDDLAVGAPLDDVDELPVGNDSAGAVHVYYGSDTGLASSSHELWVQARVWTKNPDVPIAPSSTGSWFGWALATGDFDGDSVDDLAVGAPHQSSTTVTTYGMVHIVFGTAGLGLDEQRTQHWDQGDLKGDETEPGDSFGIRLAAADFNGDDADDLAIGSHEDAASSHWEEKIFAGAVQVLYGATGIGLIKTGQQVWNADSEGVPGKSQRTVYFGTSLAPADFDADGNVDLAIGTPSEDLGDFHTVGVVRVLHGADDSGLTADGTQIWTLNR